MEFKINDVVKTTTGNYDLIGRVIDIQENNVVVECDGESWKISPYKLKLLKRKEEPMKTIAEDIKSRYVIISFSTVEGDRVDYFPLIVGNRVTIINENNIMVTGDIVRLYETGFDLEQYNTVDSFVVMHFASYSDIYQIHLWSTPTETINVVRVY